jgi:hypothetical protein
MSSTLRVVQRCRSTLFLVAVFLFATRFQGGTSVLALADNCLNVCGPTTDCAAECTAYWPEQPGFDTTCGSFAGGAAEYQCFTGYCEDGLCDTVRGESCGNCSADCGSCPPPPSCGANGCEAGENCRSCPTDCGYCPTPPADNDQSCSDDEDPSSPDCIDLGYCTSSTECNARWNGNPNGYACVGHVCLPNNLPDYKPSCDGAEDCGWGEICKSDDKWKTCNYYYWGYICYTVPTCMPFAAGG